MSDFFDRLNDLLKTNHTTQTALADAIGIRRANFSDWKKNGNLPSADIAYKIAQALNTTVEYLVTGKETNPDTQKLNNLLAQLQELINTNRNTPFTSPKTYGHQEDNPQADTSKA